jgi:hypothetical protein
MGFGRPTSAGLRAHWQLENENDSGAGGHTLTNNNSVPFAQAKWVNGADFGSSGTNKSFTLTSTNIFSALKVDEVMISFWFKLNSTANTSRRHLFFIIGSASGTTNGMSLFCEYQIVSGVMNILAGRGTPSSSHNVTLSITPDTQWHYCQVNKTKTGTNFFMGVNIDRILANTTQSTAADTSFSTAPTTIPVSIGSDRGSTLQTFAIMDEVIVDEGIYAPGGNLSDRMKYYTQAKGRFCI